MNSQPTQDQINLAMQKMQAKMSEAQKQQGLGRGIISFENNGYRFVAVGGRAYYEKAERWKTFHDFLFHYLGNFFNKEWAGKELAKPTESRHPVFLWRELTVQTMKANSSNSGSINEALMTGAMAAYFNLSYNLYLLAHNVGIQERLIRRLKDTTLFRGALYETYVTAEFIKAGYNLEIENEEDSRTTHCEFTAVSPKTGRKYSIEAKARGPNKSNVAVGNQLYEALKKDAKFERVIFIDVNAADFIQSVETISKEISDKEKTLKIDGQPAPPAYIFLTNHPFEYSLQETSMPKTGFADGFKIQDFKFDSRFFNVRDVLKARKKHADMFHLIRSMCDHYEIPATFDGSRPEFAFTTNNDPVRLLIGQKYFVPGADGKNIPAILMSATVSETEKQIWGVYKTDQGEQFICTNPMTERELMAYKRQPETFFGVYSHQGGKAQSPMDMFDFFYESYKNTPRERLLEFLKAQPDIERLKSLADDELLITACERWMYGTMIRSANHPASVAPQPLTSPPSPWSLAQTKVIS